MRHFTVAGRPKASPTLRAVGRDRHIDERVRSEKCVELQERIGEGGQAGQRNIDSNSLRGVLEGSMRLQQTLRPY